MRFATILVFLCALQGCGQKGPLFLPAAQTQTPGAQLPDSQGSGEPSSQPSQ
ncbi:MAG TPA: lipoprotein [Gallionella sp.]